MRASIRHDSRVMHNLDLSVSGKESRDSMAYQDEDGVLKDKLYITSALALAMERGSCAP
jgi:hypothetical protein